MRVKTAMPVPYEERTVKIKSKKTGNSGFTNQLTLDLFKDHYCVLRQVIPKDIIDFCMNVWLHVEHNTKFSSLPLNKYSEREGSITTTLFGREASEISNGENCSVFGPALQHEVKKVLERYLDVALVDTYSYQRQYHRGAFLPAHTDRISCEVSTTMCLDFQTDDKHPWKIWLRNDDEYECQGNANIRSENYPSITQELPMVERKKLGLKCLELWPGDLLVYLGPRVIHWRDKLVGDFSYHSFNHFALKVNGWMDYYKLAAKNGDIAGISGCGEDEYPLENEGYPNKFTNDPKKQQSEDFLSITQWVNELTWTKDNFDALYKLNAYHPSNYEVLKDE